MLFVLCGFALGAATANYRWWVMLAQVVGIYSLAAGRPKAALFFGVTGNRELTPGIGLIALALHVAFSFAAATEAWRSRLSLMLAPVGLLHDRRDDRTRRLKVSCRSWHRLARHPLSTRSIVRRPTGQT